MKRGLSGKLALDTRALIELIFSSPTGLKLKEALKNERIKAYTTELHIAELRYILCRRLGPTESNGRVNNLLTSCYVGVERISHLCMEASKYKCERAISLADCFCLALAKRYTYTATFARRERDLIAEIQKEQFDVEISFLEDYI
jgi:predicted nucleic acid-binding protein